MKTTVLIFALLVSVSSVAQVLHSKDQKFVRVYDLDHKLLNKGLLYQLTDSTLTLRHGKQLDVVDINNISSIKYKKSKRGSGFISALIGGGALGLIGAVSAEPDKDIMGYSAGEGFAMGFLIGVPVGVVAHGISNGLKKQRIVNINGDLNNWLVFKNALLLGE